MTAAGEGRSAGGPLRRRARPRQPNPQGARHIGGALESTLAGLGVAGVVEQHAVFREWMDRVGPEIARAARPHRVEGDTLFVHVANSAWMNELSLRQPELLARLNAGRAHSAVARIIFRLDPEG